jgi:hypothetical protein
MKMDSLYYLIKDENESLLEVHMYMAKYTINFFTFYGFL